MIVQFTIKQMECLGSGRSGAVYKGEGVAIKKFILAENYQFMPEEFAREVFIMKKLDHPYIMSLISASARHYMPLGRTDLRQLVVEGIEFDVKKMAGKIALGLIYLQNNNIFHGDVKPENIIIMEDLTPKIADFGTAVVNACTYPKMTSDACYFFEGY